MKNSQYFAICQDRSLKISPKQVEDAIRACYQDARDYVSKPTYSDWQISNKEKPAALTLQFFAGENNYEDASWGKLLEEVNHYEDIFSDMDRRVRLMYGYYSKQEFAKSVGISQFKNLGSSNLWRKFKNWSENQDLSYSIVKKTSEGRGFSGYYVDNGKSYVKNSWSKYGDDIKRLGYPNIFVYWVSTGKNPSTLLAALDWVLNDLTQDESASKYNVSAQGLRGVQEHFKSIDGLPSSLVKKCEKKGWNLC